MRTLNWGDSGDDVAALQQALQELGYLDAAIDGRFGAQTRRAVIAFQRARRLVADGIAGPATLQAIGLDEPVAPSDDSAYVPPAEGGAGLSLHIGVNSVDPQEYGGWSGALAGCEHDAGTMMQIARAEGFTTRQLLTEDATSENVLGAIAGAAQDLGPGGTFLLTYAGHGGQVPNAGSDAEVDQKDETWVLYDRMLLDDELSVAFTAFREGVDIVLLSDSCHSGTVYRLAPGFDESEYAAVKRAFYENLGLGRDPMSVLGAIPHPVLQVPTAVRGRSVARVRPTVYRGNGGGGVAAPPRPVLRGSRPGGAAIANGASGAVVTRDMPLDVNDDVVGRDAPFYRLIQERVRSRGAIAASGVAISGCQDNQLSQEVNGAGVFTTTLHRTWADNSFTGSYEALHRQIVAQMGPNQTPELGSFGSQPETLLARTPFTP
jgi:metacaspase-1